jgi:hypothetical protein
VTFHFRYRDATAKNALFLLVAGGNAGKLSCQVAIGGNGGKIRAQLQVQLDVVCLAQQQRAWVGICRTIIYDFFTISF